MLAAADGIISQLHMLRISKCISWVLQIPVFQQLSSWGSDPCDWTLCPYPWFGAHVLYPRSWDAMSSVTWYWLPNVGRSCDSHWDLIACIIGHLNSNLTLPLNRYHGPLWYCQTRIGIGMTLAYKSLSYRSDSRVRGDCDRRPVPVCEDWL